MDKFSHDWSTFTKRINVKASKETLYRAWTVQEEIEKWLLSQAAFFDADGKAKPNTTSISQGDSYDWMWHGSDFVAKGEVLLVNGKDQLIFTFLGCKVEVQIIEEAGESIMELNQSEIPLDEKSKVDLHLGCIRGWTFYMANLKSIYEGGVDLRNKNKDLKGVINT